jgi:trigger factor
VNVSKTIWYCSSRSGSSSDLTGTFSNEEKETQQQLFDIFKDKATDKHQKKVGDVVTVNTNGLFEDAHQLMDVMKVDDDDSHLLLM